MDQQYPRMSLGHVLVELRGLGVPETIASSVTVGQNLVKYGTDVFTEFKYFERLAQPLFRFTYQWATFNNHRHFLEKGVLRSNLHLSLSVDGKPELFVFRRDATESLRRFLHALISAISPTESGGPSVTLTYSSGQSAYALWTLTS